MLSKRIWLVLLISIPLLVFVFFFGNQKKNNSNQSVQFDTKGKVSEIILRHKGESFEIHPGNDAWVYKEQRIKTRRIESLLGALSELTIYAPASNTKYQAYKDSLNNTGTTIEVRKRMKKNYNVTLAEVNGKYILQPGKSELIYLVEVKGLPDLNLKHYYQFSPMWLENYLFTLPSSQIKKLSISYQKVVNNNFSIEASESNYMLSSAHHLIGIDTFEIKSYLAFYEAVHYIPEETIQQDITEAFFTLQVNYPNEKIHLKAYHLKPDHKNYKNYFAAKLNEEQWVLLRYLDFDALLVTPDYFQKK